MKKFLALVLAVLMLSALALSTFAVAIDTPTNRVPGNTFRPIPVYQTCKLNLRGLRTWIYKIYSEVEGEGTTTVSAVYAKTGDVVKVTVEAAEGYEFLGIAVVDGLGNEQKVNAQEDGTFTFVMPESKAVVTTIYGEIIVEVEEVEEAAEEEVLEEVVEEEVVAIADEAAE